MTVFVTDGDQRPALAIARTLGRQGLTVLVGEERPTSLASASRYCARHVIYPSPYREPDAFDRFLQNLVAQERIDVLLPVTDVTTYAVARHQDALAAHCATSVPAFDAFDFAADKWRLLQAAARCGIEIPRTVFLEHGGALPRVLPQVTYPAVVKPARSRIRTPRGWLSTSVAYARSEADLRRLYETRRYLADYQSLIQERVTGAGVGVFALCDRGELRATFSHVRLREKPPSGGVSVLSESIALEPALRAQAERLLGSLGWHGVAMLEYKRDPRTGRSVLMEVNGRFWGSLQLAVDAGVDFPRLSHQLALGQPIEPPASYRVGVRSRWWLGDLDHLVARLMHPGADLPEGAPTRLRSAIEFFVPRGGSGHQRAEILRLDDPGPAWHELRRYLADAARSLAGRVTGPRRATRSAARDDDHLAEDRSPGYVRSLR